MVKGIGRYVLLILAIAFMAVAANAYTLVLRDGRRFEIPDNFVVSKLTLTYELAPGIQKTVQIAAVDVTATERANNETPGSFLKRATIQAPLSIASVQSGTVRRSVTNQNLDRFKVSRLESEAAYDRRQKELGLPTLAESRRAAEVQTERTREQLLASRAQELETESYWRTRASELRAEIAATNARIDYVRARLNELPPVPAFGVFTTALPFGLNVQSGFNQFGHRGFRQPNLFFPRAPLAPINPLPQITGGVRFGGGNTRTRVFVNPVRSLHRSHVTGSIGFFPSVPLLGIPFQDSDYTYERSALVAQLDELLGYRAGLQARWRDLEDEARRAGAYPGWLRP